MDEIVFYAFHGIKANSKRHDAFLRNLPYLGIACVGIGSAVFHSTMKNYTQWCKWHPLKYLSLSERLRIENPSLGETVSDRLLP
jgi:hypothetical protein